jgi:hypothetical protein
VHEYSDADGTLVFIKGSQLPDAVIAHRFFLGRFIAKMA